jgi:hypothetical protein
VGAASGDIKKQDGRSNRYDLDDPKRSAARWCGAVRQRRPAAGAGWYEAAGGQASTGCTLDFGEMYELYVQLHDTG